jgi:hypothetical protein
LRGEKFLLQPQPASSLSVDAAAQISCPARNTRQEAPVLHSGAAYVHLRPFVLDPEWQPSKISGNHLCSRTSCDGLLLFAPDALPRVGRMLFHPAGRHFTHRVPCTRHLPGRHCAPDLHKDTVMIPPRRRAGMRSAHLRTRWSVVVCATMGGRQRRCAARQQRSCTCARACHSLHLELRASEFVWCHTKEAACACSASKTRTF